MALAAGDALGLLAGGRAPDLARWAPAVWCGAALGLLVAAAGRSRRAGSGRPRPRGPGPGTSRALATLACLGAGLLLGLPPGARGGGSCLASLADGEPLAAAGTWTAGGRTLEDAALAGAPGRCRVPRLRVRLRLPADPPAPGERVLARGRWSARRGAPGPREPAALGTLLGTVERVEPARPVPPRVGRGTRAETRRGPGLPARLRAAAGRRLDGLLPPDLRPVGRALVLADGSDLDPAVRRRFADAGLAHLLAISGLHVGLLAAGALGIAGLLLGPRRRLPVAAAAVLGYVLLIGAPPAAVRAGLLVAGWTACRLRGAPARLGDLAGLAAAVAIVADPRVVGTIGFQLSFAGFAGLLAGDRAAARILTRPTGSWRRRWARPLRTLAAGAGAFLLTAPLVAVHFERVAPAAVLSGPVGTPLVGLALAGLFGTLLLPSPAAGLAADGAAGALRLLDAVAGWFAGLPLHAEVAAPGPVAWGVLALLAGAGGAWLAGRRPGRAIVPLGCAAALWLAGPAWGALRHGGHTLVCSLDVGQGDAAAVRTRAGRWILLDAGPGRGFLVERPPGGGSGAPWSGPPAAGAAGRRTVVPFLRDRGARSVALFVLSHPHLDHVGGAWAVFDRFPVLRVLEAGRPVASLPYLGFLEGVEREGAAWIRGRPGLRMRVDEVRLLVLGPAPAPRRGGAAAGAVGPGPPGAAGSDATRGAALAEDANDVSVSVRLQVGEGPGAFVYLNTGDAPAEEERTLLEAWPADTLRADLLKLGHHGSRTSTAAAWLRAVRPRVAVVSAGRANRYGHPHREVLERLEDAGVETVWRTDRSGTLCVRVGRDGRWSVPEPAPG